MLVILSHSHTRLLINFTVRGQLIWESLEKTPTPPQKKKIILAFYGPQQILHIVKVTPYLIAVENMNILAANRAKVHQIVLYLQSCYFIRSVFTTSGFYIQYFNSLFTALYYFHEFY